MEKEILTTFEAAKYCHVHPGTIKNWIKNGQLKAFKTPGGHHRIYRRDLDLFLKDNNIPLFCESKSQRRRVLIIDSDYRVRENISRLLLRHTERFEVAAASNGFEGGELLVAFKPDLVILDQNLPGVNAVEIAQRIRTSPYLDEARVILLTDSPVERKPAGQGADQYLSKTMEPENLSREIEKLLSAGKLK
jgi:excisionase family DNA binding protein